jgi:4'-phosphopantetheinyl transferase
MAKIRKIGRLHLTNQAVHLWIAKLDCSGPLLNELAKTLSVDEAERADSFLFARDRGRFIARRGILRAIISRYLGCSPEETRFTYNPNGKPKLGPMQGSTRDLRFNLSHCADMALYGVTRGRELGVDVESIRDGMPWRALAASFFTRAEVAQLDRCPPHQRATGFFTCWARKEAYVKASGEGLSASLHSRQVSLTPDEAPGLLTALKPEELERWSVWEVPLGDGFAGALVTEGHPSQIRCLRWNWSCT